MNIFILIFLLAGCKTSSSSSSKMSSEATSVKTESGTTTTQADAHTTVKKKIERDASKITKTEDTFEIVQNPVGPPVSVLKNHKTTVKDIGKKTEVVDVSKDEQLKKLEELNQKLEEARKLAAAKAADNKMEPAIGCTAPGWLWIVVIGAALVYVLRNFGSKLPFPLNILSKKKE